MAVVRFNRADRRWPAVDLLPMALLGVWVALVGVFMLVKPAGSDATLCVFRNLTGVPCPTCGSTRAALAVARGHLLEALALNPLVTAAAFAALAWLAVRIGLRISIRLNVAAWLTSVVFVVLLAANWAYVILGHA